MPRRKKGEPPRLCEHKASGQGFVRVKGKCIYLGPFASPECNRRYRLELARWQEEQKAELPRAGRELYLGRETTVAQLVGAFMQEVVPARYHHADGTPTSSAARFRVYLVDGLARQFGDELADDFRHPEFDALRRSYIRQGKARNTIKMIVSCVLVLYRWAYKRGIISVETLTSLKVSPEPDEGQEREPVEPVPAEILERLHHYLARPYRQRRQPEGLDKRKRLLTMLQIQELVGMRPGELCRMARSELRMDGTVKIRGKPVPVLDDQGQPCACWIFQPERHKTVKKGKTVAYLIGPRARELLTPWLPEEGYLWPGRDPAKPMTFTNYTITLRNACRMAGIAPFGPNRLRHGTATRYSKIAGLDKASQVLNHANLDTTQVYVQRSLGTVAELVEKYG